MVTYNPKNPFRPANWRWERARTLRESGRVRPGTNEDEWSTAAFKLQIGMAKNPEPESQITLADAYPDLYYAYTIYRRQSGEENRHPLRFMIEARLLADQTDEDIGQAAGIEPTLVTWYEKVFFNVREKLRNPDYILAVVVGPALYTGMSEREYDLLWKVFGYLYGPMVLDAFIRSTTGTFRPEHEEEVEACIMTDTKSAIRRKAAIAARTFTINNFTQGELLTIYSKFLELEKDTGGDSAKDFFLNNIQIILKKMPWVAGNDSIDHDVLQQYDSQSAELRTHELLQVAEGIPLPNRDEISKLTFPEPASDEKTQQG